MEAALPAPLVTASRKSSRDVFLRRRYGREAVPPLRAPGQEGSRTRAGLGPARRGPLQGRRRQPHHEGGSARGADPGCDRRRVAATHAILSDSATEILQSEFIDAVVVTDTLPIPEEKRRDRLTILPIVHLTARAIHEAFDDGSVTSMFDGAA